MNAMREFLNALTLRNRKKFAGLTTPEKIQDFLDNIAYCGDDDDYHCPLVLIESGRGCCFAGALFGALALRRLGNKPLVVELKSENDDDHILAVYKKNGCWGAVAKSHYAGLRSREPVYRTLRELAMSYFEHYYNRRRERTLRSYSVPLDLGKYDALHWMTLDDRMNDVADAIDRLRHVPLFPRRLAQWFTKADKILCRAGIADTAVKKGRQKMGAANSVAGTATRKPALCGQDGLLQQLSGHHCVHRIQK